MAEIRTLTAEDWPVVETNYASGIATGGATFVTEPSSWEVSVVGARLLAWPRSWTFSGLANQLAIQRVRSLPITVEAVPTMTPVELVRVPAEKSPHPGAERRLGRLDHHVDVRVHEAEGVDSPAAPFGHASKTADERKTVIVVENDAAARVSARDDVLDRARGLDTPLA